ncbi:hypothetical protein [Kitasatospora sp. NPDC088134]|uniref:hypothetical protein n=1 Tax=Kitasatospora sp. NPDC088134 TaxID=3364071 RepID=UPI003814DC22
MSRPISAVPVRPVSTSADAAPARTRRWWRRVLVGSVLVLAAAGLVALVYPRTVVLASLPVGACFDLRSDRLDTVRPTACTDPHLGEVTGQFPVDLEREPHHDAELAAALACSPAVTAYVPDYWSLPPSLGYDYHLSTDPGRTPHVTCYLTALNDRVTGPSRPHAPAPTEAQRAYLTAVDRYDEVSALDIDQAEGATSVEIRDWTAWMADAEQQLTDDLARLAPPPGAEAPLAAVLASHRSALAHWRAAAALDPGRSFLEIRRAADAARADEHAAMDPDAEVRRALGLATTMRPRGWSL